MKNKKPDRIQLFESFLRTQFKDKPGEDKIFKGLFHIIDVKNKGAIVRKEHWHRSISPGAVLTMSVIMSYLRRRAGSCARPDCIGVGVSESGDLGVVVWYDLLPERGSDKTEPR